MLEKRILTPCGKLHSRSNISKHKRSCGKCNGVVFGIPVQNECKISQNTDSIILPYDTDTKIDTREVSKILEPAPDSVPRFVILKYFRYGGGNLRIPNKSANRIEIYTQKNIWITTKRVCDLVEIEAAKLSSSWNMWYRCEYKSTILDIQLRNEKRLTQAVMHAILDVQKHGISCILEP
jgi:hypothetical protein